MDGRPISVRHRLNHVTGTGFRGHRATVFSFSLNLSSCLIHLDSGTACRMPSSSSSLSDAPLAEDNIMPQGRGVRARRGLSQRAPSSTNEKQSESRRKTSTLTVPTTEDIFDQSTCRDRSISALADSVPGASTAPATGDASREALNGGPSATSEDEDHRSILFSEQAKDGSGEPVDAVTSFALEYGMTSTRLTGETRPSDLDDDSLRDAEYSVRGNQNLLSDTLNARSEIPLDQSARHRSDHRHRDEDGGDGRSRPRGDNTANANPSAASDFDDRHCSEHSSPGGRDEQDQDDFTYHSGDTAEYDMPHRPVLERTAIKRDIRGFMTQMSVLRDRSYRPSNWDVVDKLGEGTFSLTYWRGLGISHNRHLLLGVCRF